MKRPRKTKQVNDPAATYSSADKQPVKNSLSKKSKDTKPTSEDYTLPGKPMSMGEFQKHIDNALAGKSTSHIDFLKEMESWD